MAEGRNKVIFCLHETADMSAMWHSTHVNCVAQQTCLMYDTTDMSAVWQSRHVCCVTRQTCLLCDAANMPHLLATQSHGFASRQERGKPPPCPRRNSPLGYIQNLHHSQRWFCGAGGHPATQNHGFVVQTKFWTLQYNLLLDHDTCLTPGAQNWTDLFCRVDLSVCNGSGPKIEGSAPNVWIKSKSMLHQQLRLLERYNLSSRFRA